MARPPFVSGSFAAEANSAKVVYDVGRAQAATGGKADSASVSYDASADRYTLTVGADVFEFDRTDAYIDASNALFFGRGDIGNTTGFQLHWGVDSNWRIEPEYVTYAQLLTLKRDIPNGTDTYRTDDLIFGFPSDFANVPKAGNASFTLSLLGSRSSSASDELLLMDGAGMALVDFATGQLNIQGNTRSGLWSGGWTANADLWGTVNGTAALAADKNGFTGTFHTAGAPDTYSGTFTGSFYGPEADEIGGTFYGTSGSLYYSLAFIGSEQPDVAPGNTLAALTGTNRLDTVERVIPLPDNDPNFSEYPFDEHVIYDADTKTYEIFGISAGAFGAVNRTPANDQSDIVSYGSAVAHVDGKLSYDVGRFDGESDGIELTYVSFFRVVETLTDLDTNVLDREVRYVGFGNATPADQLPRTGTASYEGRLFGDVNDGVNLLSPLRGTAALDVNFGTQTLTASLSPRATNLYGGVENFGTFNFAGSLDSFRGYFEALRVGGGDGSLAGRFFGDRAQEFAATFGINLADRGLMLEGVAVGRQVTTP